WTDVESDKITPQQAFSKMEDWIIQLGERKAFLHPNLKQWMWYDKLHDEWVFAGCGVSEAILLTIGKLGGVKKLPEPDAIDAWCVYRQEQELLGPLRIEELRNQLESQKIPQDILIWSTRADDWFSTTDEKAKVVIFTSDVAGN
ncbi:MAG: hypothetical protein HQ525_06125, partial [Anaerolineae bacterium]|nr:hypothetical protein [Anaerolineae bacterium]